MTVKCDFRTAQYKQAYIDTAEYSTVEKQLKRPKQIIHTHKTSISARAKRYAIFYTIRLGKI